MDTVVCPNPWCRLEFGNVEWEQALQRSRFDKSFFWHYFLLRCPHPGQREFISNSEATINALACSNRYGKTTLLAGEHYHACIFKSGAESRYIDDEGVVDERAFMKERYRTAHTAVEWDQAKEVWDDALSLKNDSPRLEAFIKNAPLTVPPHIDFVNGARWIFRTLGSNASNIDGKNFYLLSIDEAGWAKDLETMMGNVLRVRVADVRGRIVIVGTFKPGISKDFLKICVRASAYTGAALGFDHRADVDDDTGEQAASLDSSLRKYAREFGLDLDAEIARLKGAQDAAA